MAQQHNPLHLTLISLGLLCLEALPGQASPRPLDIQPALEQALAPQPHTLPLAPVPSASGDAAGALDTGASDAPAASLPSPALTATDPALASGLYLTTAAALTPEPEFSPAVANNSDEAGKGLAQADLNDETLPSDPELGVIQVRSLAEDADLGILRIRQPPEIPVLAAPPSPKVGFLTARLAIANSDNILLAFNDVGGLTGDTFLRPSLAFAVYPTLGPQTVLIGTADLGLQRYVSQSTLNYDDLRFRVGLRQGLSPRSYGQLMFTYQELFRPGGNRARFFKNTSLGLTLGRRDPIAPRLTFDSYYQIQFNGAQSRSETASGPVITDFSRLFQSAGGYLGYEISPQLQAGLSYQLNLIDYTAQDRYDAFQQILGQVVYRITPRVRLSVYGGVSFGRSSEPRVQFNDTFFGAAIDATIPLF
ncbi:MAG: hypothetical protein EA368_07380 [Leptolyngbya sp. DLM2.Bin27]|nr:MAG: hypothetical protein EA368_07380 [Leptolyngbya sp. DLM2.Bin27]